jgi:CBS domain containing-hemolysin-like protein
MIEGLFTAIALALLLGIGFCSGCEMGMYCLNRVRLRLLSEGDGAASRREQHNARTLLDLYNHQQESVLAILLWQNVLGYLITVATSMWLTKLAGADETHAEFYSALILTPLIFVFGEVVPKNWFQIEADRLMYPCARVLRAAVVVLHFTGVLWLIQQTSRFTARWLGEDEREDWLGARGEVIGLLREGAAGGALSEEQTQIVERVLNLSHIQVRNIMIPRRRVVVIPAHADRRLFESIVRNHSYSRMPVLAADQRNVLGMVRVAEVLSDEGDFDLRKWLQPAITLSGYESAANTLVKLQQSGTAMAMVADPRNEFIGIVTLKDVVEEIFGELPAW